MRAYRREYERKVLPYLREDAMSTLANDFDVLGLQVQVAIGPTVGPLFDRMARDARRANAKGQALLGITAKDTGVEARIIAARDENIKLVENAHRVYARQVREVFDDPQNFGMRVENLKAKLRERGDVSESRAELIARDQTLKLNAAITEERQKNAGVEAYVWSTSLDERVREEHQVLEGQTFLWSSPPAPGHPGEDFQCRCVAIPVIEELEGVF